MSWVPYTSMKFLIYKKYIQKYKKCKYSSPPLIRPLYLPRNCGHIKEVAFGERENLNVFIVALATNFDQIREGGLCWEWPLREGPLQWQKLTCMLIQLEAEYLRSRCSFMPWSHFFRCPSWWVCDLICIHLYTSPGSTPAALRWHWGGAGKFGHRRKASQVLTTPLKFFRHRRSLICKWGITNTSPNYRAVAADIKGWHCGSRPADVRCIWAWGHLGNFSDTMAMSRSLGVGCETGGRWHGGSTAMFILSGDGCRVTSLWSCHRPMSAAAAMLSQGGTSASGAPRSQNISLEFLGYSQFNHGIVTFTNTDCNNSGLSSLSCV